jgi:hypothetical protein
MSDTFIVIEANGKPCNSVLHSKSPAAAAKKAYRHCVRDSLKNKKQRSRPHRISVKRKNKDKVFTYNVKEHYKPTTIMIAGKPVRFRYSTKAKRVMHKK